jgi:hypothetical protein
MTETASIMKNRANLFSISTRTLDIEFIGRELDRHAIEVMCLVMDQAEKGYIAAREGGIMGNRGEKEKSNNEAR